MPDVVILDRLLDEFDRDARIALHDLLRDAMRPMIIVTTGSICDSFPPDIELDVSDQRVELLTELFPSEHIADDEAIADLTIRADSHNLYDSRPLAVVSGCTVLRSNRKVLANVALTIKSGNLYWLLGPNGCGKSTFLEALCGLLPTVPPTEFKIFIGSEAQIESCTEQMLLAYSPQDPEGDVTELTLLEEVRLAQETSHRIGMINTATEAWLDRLGISEQRRNLPLSDDV